ncbi:MAG: hypothetical protein HUJ71_06980 [Pseudobutyrivibrio sp.]|nr:hypothetical protein [Pseudobutyrivibrio sp.]
MASYKVGEFTFSDEATAKKAANELKAINYLMPQLKNAKDSDILKAYNQLVQRKMFSTVVGLSFLQQLQNNLISSSTINNKDILPLYSVGDIKPADNKDNEPVKKVPNRGAVTTSKTKSDLAKENKRLKAFNTFLVVICLTLLTAVIGMFYVSSTINSPTILNYEEELINKYVDWEQELEEKEMELLQRERALNK